MDLGLLKNANNKKVIFPLQLPFKGMIQPKHPSTASAVYIITSMKYTSSADAGFHRRGGNQLPPAGKKSTTNVLEARIHLGKILVLFEQMHAL